MEEKCNGYDYQKGRKDRKDQKERNSPERLHEMSMEEKEKPLLPETGEGKKEQEIKKASGKAPGLVDLVWKFFSSVKLAVVLIALIALTSIAGTIIEQNAEPEKNMKLFVKIFGNDLAPSLFKVSYSMGLMDMYHSWWFLGILFLLSSNLIICSLDRLPRIHKAVTDPVHPLKPDAFDKFGIKKEIVLEGTKDTVDSVRERIRTIVHHLGFTTQEESLQEAYQLYGQKWQKTRYAVYIIHLSIIVIFIGAIIGIFFGFNGYLNLPEGDQSAIAYSRKGVEHPLGFTVKCEDFAVNFYGQSDMPKEYISWLSIIDNGKEVITAKPIEVNSPLTYKGYTFYQSNYGPVPNAKGLLVLNITPKAGPNAGRKETLSLHTGESFPVAGTDLVGTVIVFTPALNFDKDKKPFTYTNMMNNPAIFVNFTEKGEEKYGGWIVKRYPQTWTLPDGHTIELVDNFGYQYTGLQVRKDPGVWIVYLGCLTMTLGLYAAFFLSHRKIWVLVRRRQGKTVVTIAASTNKHKVAYEEKINKAFAQLQQKI